MRQLVVRSVARMCSISTLLGAIEACDCRVAPAIGIGMVR
jgi:hypothetical protein